MYKFLMEKEPQKEEKKLYKIFFLIFFPGGKCSMYYYSFWSPPFSMPISTLFSNKETKVPS